MADAAERTGEDEARTVPEPAPEPGPAPTGELSEAELEVVSGGFRGAKLLTIAQERAMLRGDK